MSAAPVLEIRDLRKDYRSGSEVVHAVDGVSLSIDAGELVALYGPSGSGKSTLLRIAAGIDQPDSGEVLVKGVDITKLSDKDSATYRMYMLGWVNQTSDLMDGATALDNAALKQMVVARSVRRARRVVAPLLEELGLGERLNHRAETLSMGERQRVMIARALSVDPQVMLADEPTGSLDSRRTHEVLALLQRYTHERQMATLLVTHDEHAIAYADRVYTLQDGVLHDGPEVLTVP